jgi:hypothetical protein
MKFPELTFTLFFLIIINGAKSQQINRSYPTNAYLYNGTEYIPHSPRINGTAYFPNKDYQTGYVNYSGVNYQNISLRYDVVRDELITPYFGDNTEISLLPAFVSNFSFGNMKFVYLNVDTTIGLKAPSGYFQEVIKDAVSFYVKRKKIIKETTSVRDITSDFMTSDDFYISKGNVFSKVSGKSDVLRVFKDKRKELNNFLKDEGLSFRDNPELAIEKMVIQYNALTN